MRYALILLFTLLAEPGLAAEPTEVRFPSRDPSATVISGYLFAASGVGPRPAMVLMHGCGGMWTKSHRISSRERFWAEHLAAMGVHALLVDSFGPRGIDELCTKSARALSAVRDRPFDAFGALRYLQSRSDVAGDRVGLFGWSNGAMATLASLGESWPDRGFRLGVAFYPGCTLEGAYKDRPWSAAAPVLMLLGGADDWTPARYCRDLAAKSEGRGAAVTVHVYPGAYHDFDRPVGQVHTREVRNPAWGKEARTVHLGPDPKARKAAVETVTAWLKANLLAN